MQITNKSSIFVERNICKAKENILSLSTNKSIAVMQAKPFIKWAGGKGQLLEQLDRRLPADFATMKDVTYIEPFIGGGAMLFYMLQKYPNIKKAAICDINVRLIKCYTLIKNNPDVIISSLKDIQNRYYKQTSLDEKKDFFLQARERYNSSDISDLESSTLLIFLNRTCFNGLYRENKSGKFNVPFGRYEHPLICDEANLKEVSKLLQKVEILSGDYSCCAKYAKGNSFFYLDPPYKPRSKTSNFNSYSKESFNDAEQIRLKQFCDNIDASGHYFLLSNSDCEESDFFETLYQDYNIDKVKAKRNINANAQGRGAITEITVCNYPTTASYTLNADAQTYIVAESPHKYETTI